MMPTMSVEGMGRSLGMKQDAKKPLSCMIEGRGRGLLVRDRGRRHSRVGRM